MEWRKAPAWLAWPAAAALLTGCFGIGAGTPADLMAPPRLEVNQQVVKEVVQEKLLKDELLYTPLEPRDLSAINFTDLDGDDKNEAVVFYKNSVNYRLGAYVFRNEDETWRQVSKIESSGVDIAFGGFYDLTGDGKKEILVAWSADKLDVFLDKFMTIYRYGETVEPLYNDSYTEMAVGDFDRDGSVEVMLFNLIRSMNDPASTGELLVYREGAFEILDRITLDPYINGYYNVLVGPASPDKTGIFLDMGIGAHSAATYLLVVENGEIQNVFNSPGSSFYSKTAKAYAIESQDINGDGFIEIGTYEEPYGNTRSMADTPWILNWHQWDGKDTLKPVLQNFLDAETHLRIDFPPEWTDRVTVRYVEDGLGGVEIAFVDREEGKTYPIYRMWSVQVDEAPEVLEGLESGHFVAGEEGGRIRIVERAHERQEPPFRIRQAYMKTVVGEETLKTRVKTWR